jgi:hypothetical protein
MMATELSTLLTMTTRPSVYWKWILITSQLVVIGELIATHTTPLARQFKGWSAYAAMIAMAAFVFLVVGSPFFWRSNRWLAISGLCIAVGVILILI